MSNSPSYTLSQVTDQFLIRKGNLKRKHYAETLIIAQDVWKFLFWNTLWAVKNTWIPLQNDGGPYNYIEVPEGTVKVLSVNIEDECGKLHPLYYNAALNVIPKPTQTTSCGCKNCDCNSALCGTVYTTSLVTKPIVISGQTYYEKTWMKYCPNGDVIEYQEIPTKKYTTIQQAGDYNLDYNNDYDIIAAFEDFTIVTVKKQKLICKLELKECGCPKDTEENEQLFLDNCGCGLSAFNIKRVCNYRAKRAAHNSFGEIKFSECGTKIYVVPFEKCDGRPAFKMDFCQLSLLTDGVTPDEEIQVPDYSRKCLWACLDSDIKEFNDRYSYNEKESARINKEREINNLIKFLNPLSEEFLATIQEIIPRW